MIALVSAAISSRAHRRVVRPVEAAQDRCDLPPEHGVVDDLAAGHHGRVFNSGLPDDHGPDLSGPDIAAESWLGQDRIDLLGWLENNAPTIAPIYRGALAIAMSDSFPGRAHFVAHAIREIRNRLPDALGLRVGRRDARYEQFTDKVRERWLADGLPEDGRLSQAGSAPLASGPPGRRVSDEFLASVGELIEEHNEAQENRRIRDEHAFSALSDRGPVPPYFVDYWRRLYRDAHGVAHLRDEPLPAEADGEWVANFREFEDILMALSKRSYESLDDLDILLERANTR